MLFVLLRNSQGLIIKADASLFAASSAIEAKIRAALGKKSKLPDIYYNVGGFGPIEIKRLSWNGFTGIIIQQRVVILSISFAHVIGVYWWSSVKVEREVVTWQMLRIGVCKHTTDIELVKK